MATVNDIPPTDDLFRPILETLRVEGHSSMFGDLVRALYSTLGLPAGQTKLRRILSSRVELALEFLESEKAVEAGEPSQPDDRRGLRQALSAGFKLARRSLNAGYAVSEKTWNITQSGRTVSDHELVASFHSWEIGTYRVRVATVDKWLPYRTVKKCRTLGEAIGYAESIDDDDVLVDTPPPNSQSFETTLWDKRRYHVLVRGRWRIHRTEKFREYDEALKYACSLPNEDVSIVDYNDNYKAIWKKPNT